MIRLEILSRMRDQLAVSGMIERLDAHDFRVQRRGMSFDVLDELRLGIRRSGDQDSASVGDGFGHVLEKGMIFRCVTTADAVGLVVNMSGRVVRMQYEMIDLERIEMKYASFVVIDPNDRMIQAGHMGPR